MGYSSGLMKDGGASDMAPITSAARDRINRMYASAPGALSRSMAGRGYGSSGSFGNSLYQLDTARMSDQSGLEAQIMQMLMNQKNQGASLAEQLVAMGRGTDTTGTGTGPSTSAANGFMSAGNGLENIGTLLMMSKILGGGSNPNSGGGLGGQWGTGD